MSAVWRTFFALGDPHRLEMVRRLAQDGPTTMSRLANGMPFTRQAGAKHVDVLRVAGIVSVLKRGREQVVSLEPDSLLLSQMFMDQLGQQWDDRLGRLKEMVEIRTDTGIEKRTG